MNLLPNVPESYLPLFHIENFRTIDSPEILRACVIMGAKQELVNFMKVQQKQSLRWSCIVKRSINSISSI